MFVTGACDVGGRGSSRQEERARLVSGSMLHLFHHPASVHSKKASLCIENQWRARFSSSEPTIITEFMFVNLGQVNTKKSLCIHTFQALATNIMDPGIHENMCSLPVLNG